MFERFRIKTALRAEVIRLRGTTDDGGLMRAELLFYEPAFHVAPVMKRNRWTAKQATVFMVTDVIKEVDAIGNLAAFREDDPTAHAALRVLYDHVLATAQADPALTSCISRPDAGRPAPFAE